MTTQPIAPDTLKTWPEKIYLQHGNEPSITNAVPPFPECSGITWAEDDIHGNDVEYTRDDLAQSKQAAPPDTQPKGELRMEWDNVKFEKYQRRTYTAKSIEGNCHLGAAMMPSWEWVWNGSPRLTIAELTDILAFMQQLKAINEHGTK